MNDAEPSDSKPKRDASASGFHETKNIGRIVCPWCVEVIDGEDDPGARLSDLDGHSESLDCTECHRPVIVSLSVEYTCRRDTDTQP